MIDMETQAHGPLQRHPGQKEKPTMSKCERPPVVTELPALTGSYEIDGICVNVRGFLVNEHHPRYEIVLRGAGQIAIVDVPTDERASLEERVEQAISGFVATIRSRAEASSS
jgi:hypothetical protein